MRISGGCLCGAVRFEARPGLEFQLQCYKCYCTDCRKSSGSGHSALLGMPRERSRSTEPSGNSARRPIPAAA